MTDSHVFLRHRLEPISREGDPGQGLAATVHDPLWTLGRQWQFGELNGEDTGSPVQVTMRVRSAPINSWRPAADAPAVPIDHRSGVLEATITGERPAGSLTWRDRLDAGRRLTWLLPANAVGAVLAEFPLDGAPFPDGIAVADALGGGRDLATELGADEQLRSDLTGFVTWCTTTFGRGPDVWVPSRLERQFDLLVDDAAVSLHAQNHTRPGIDWFDVDVIAESPAGPPAAAPAEASTVSTVRRIPATLRFPGMPADRFWEFEDAELALHAIDASTTDLARLALVEFSTVYGNDWFSLPLAVREGTIVKIEQMTVLDTFGRHQLIEPAIASGGPWAMHAPSMMRGGAVPWLVVPPATTAALRGPVVEEVAFVRDELANLVWAVERIVTDDRGVVHDVFAEAGAAPSAPRGVPTDAELLYQLMTEVPDYWVPFIPTHIDQERRQVGLVEAVLPRPNDFGDLAVVEPRSSTLRELQHLVLHEEEVPPAGVVVRREWWLARAADGTRVVWSARTASTGRGEGSSGLAFDVAHEVRGVR